MKYYIKEAIWQRIYTVLSQVKGLHVKDIAKLRIFLEAVWYMARSGCQWRLLPNYYGGWRTVHARFRVWAQKGIWEYLFKNVQDEPDMAGSYDRWHNRKSPCLCCWLW